MINRLLFISLLTAFSLGSAAASVPLVVNQTYNTGYNGSTALAAGSADTYFNLYSYVPTPTLTAPVVADPIPAAWDSVAGAQWISPTENQTYPAPPIEGDPAGTYDYNAVLATDFLVPTEVTVTGSFAADNDASLIIDGTTVTSVAAPAYATLTSFDYTFTIYTGERFTPIDFVVNNLDDTGGTVNPTGLLVSNLRVTTSQTPEPSTYLLMFASLGSLLMVKRVRRAVSL
jgi:hypothetical protein